MYDYLKTVLYQISVIGENSH